MQRTSPSPLLLGVKLIIIGQGGNGDPVEYWVDFYYLGLEGQQKLQTFNTLPILDNVSEREQRKNAQSMF